MARYKKCVIFFLIIKVIIIPFQQFSALNNKFSGDIVTAVRNMVKDDVWANGFQDALVAQGQFDIIQNNKILCRIKIKKKRIEI